MKKQIVVPIVGALSSAIAVCITFPFDNLRVRLQIEDSANKSIIQLVKLTILNEGVSGLYKGILPRILKKGFGGGALWLIYENVWNENPTRSV